MLHIFQQAFTAFVLPAEICARHTAGRVGWLGLGSVDHRKMAQAVWAVGDRGWLGGGDSGDGLGC